MDPYLGRKLDNRYEILERIGSGGMAIVYKAKDNRLNRLVAVKILRGDLEQDEDFRRRFNAESQAVAQLSSPHIVSIYDVSKGGDTEYIVMELIDGITLKQYMDHRGQLNWREASHFITQIMRGLAHAHSKGIVHRDIKPQNIMVLRDGGIKVADFGIAVLENSAQTLTQQALGSVHYISPEQARGERADARSDLYSAGIVLYEMLTGKLPFEGDSPVSVAIQHLSATPPAPREINPDIPAQMELICLKAMAPDLTRRYQSAEEMIGDLEAFRKDPAILLDFQMDDIRPPVSDEPTRFLDTSAEIPEYHHITDSRSRSGQDRNSNPDDFNFNSNSDPDADLDSDSNPDGDAGWKSRIPAILLAAVGVAGVILAVLLFRVVSGTFGHESAPDSYMVQSLVGYTVEQAENLEGVKGIFEIIEAGSQSSEEYPEGVIIRQNPAAEQYRKGNNLVIRVWVSSGMETETMPDVVNQTVTEAELRTLRDLIQKYNLKLEIPEDSKVYSDDYAAGRIVSSVPKAGETIHKGDVIQLIVSRGPRTVVLISFVNMTLDDANRRLKDLNLNPGSPKFIYNNEPFGTVLAQEPGVNTEVPEHTEVVFTVSRGPEPVAPEQKRDVRILLPDDRESAYLEVWQDGERIWNSLVDCTEGFKSLEMTASGESLLEIYLDRAEVFNQTVTIMPGSSPMELEVNLDALKTFGEPDTREDETRAEDEENQENQSGREDEPEENEVTEETGAPENVEASGNNNNININEENENENEPETGEDGYPESWIGTDIIREESD